jgi:hypothetical protein
MRRLVVVVAVVCGIAVPMASASYVIDGSLSDWGVTPFTQWAPAGTADYTQTNGNASLPDFGTPANGNLYNADAFDEPFDFEAMYFDNDATNFYVAIVSSYPLQPSAGLGDLGLDLNSNMAVSAHGIVTGLEYGIHIGTGTTGQIVLNPTWDRTIHKEWPDGWQGSPYWILGSSGTVVGTASVFTQYYPGMEDGTYILEMSIPRSLFPNNGGDPNDTVGLHITQWCGNDSINLMGDIDRVPPPPPVVPAPAALLLAGLGAAMVGSLRRRKLM